MELFKTGNLSRQLNFDREQIDEETRTISLSFSSEAPVERWFGSEVLSHAPESVNLERLNNKGALLANHDLNDQIGVIESATLENGRGIATVRFSRSARGEEFFRDCLDGIRTQISVGYVIEEMEERGERDFLATRWTPHEVSIVSVAADPSVGIGRSDAQGEHMTRIKRIEKQKELPKMEEQKIDIEAIRSEAQEAARAEFQQRAAKIQSMVEGAPYLRELADKAQAESWPIDKFEAEAFAAAKREAARKPEAAPQIASPLNVDMSRRESERYSLLRAVQASASGDWSRAGLEREVSDAIAERVGQSNGGFYIPTNAAWGKRDLTVGTNNAGGYMVGTDHDGASFIEALYAAMVTTQLGARTMNNLQGNVSIPKLATGTSTYWVAEATAPTEGQPVFASVNLSPKNLASYVQISRNLSIQSDPSVEAVVQDDITKAIAVAVDAAALAGTGASNQPTGILSTTGIGSVAFGVAGAPTFAEIVSIETAIVTDNAMGTNMAFVTTPALAGTLKTTTKDSGSGRFVSENGEVMGYRVYPTSSMTSNTILLGDFSQLMIAQFGALEVITERSASTGLLTLGLHLMVDIGVRYAESFAKGA